MKKNINEKSEPVFAPSGGKPGYIINGKWYPVDKADLNTPQLKREMERYAELRGVEQLKKDEASLKPKPKPAPAAPDPKPAPAAPAPAEPAKPAPAKPAPAAPAPAKPKPRPLTPNQEYQKAAAAARNVQDPEARAKAMDSVRDAGMKIWADKYKNTLAPEVVRRQERATMLGRGDTQSGYPVIKKYVKPSVEKSAPTPTATPTAVNGNPKPLLKKGDPGYEAYIRRRYFYPTSNTGAGAPMDDIKDSYDVVLDYLLSEGHAETVEEAHYVMMQLDSEYIQEVIQERAWWDPAGLFTKTDKEKALEKGGSGYSSVRGTSNRADKQQVIVAPLTTGGVTRYVTQKAGDPTKDPSIAASRMSASHPSWKPDIERLRAVAPDVISKSTQVAQGQQQLARDVAASRAQAQQLGANAYRETLAPPPVVAAKPKPKPAPVVAQPKPAVVQPKPAPEPRLTKAQQDILDLRQMRANSLNRQGNIDAAQKLQTEVDVARASKKMPPKIKPEIK